MRRTAAIVACLALGATGLAPGPSATATPTRPAHHKPGYTPPPLKWGECVDEDLVTVGAECADLVVPLDYAHPRGRTITLAVSRVVHTSPDADHQGPMLVNPGGPGGSGLIYSIFGSPLVDILPGPVEQTYDWIGFDPRGVGSSRPALSCRSDFLGYDRPSYVPRTRAIKRYWLRKSARYARSCASSPARRLLPHLKTTDTAADVESLRKALGARKISFYGFSYGSTIAQTYATLHPRRVRRLVMDGVVDPSRTPYQSNLVQNVAFNKNIQVFFGWLAKFDAVFHLGTTRRQVSRGFYRELRKLDRTPAEGVIGPDELTDVLTSAGYYVYNWVEIGRAYAALVNRGDGSAVKALFDGANPQGTPGSDNGYAIYLATQCTDAPWPRHLRRVIRDNWRYHSFAPFFTWSNAWVNGPCNFWPVKPGKKFKVSGAGLGKRPVLLVSETFDPATPFSGALEARRRFKGARLIEGVGGTTHSGSLSGVACTDNAIAAYLTDGSVPRRLPGNRSDLKCPPVPRPDPTAEQAAAQRKQSSAAERLQQRLRTELRQARLR
ncbi:MAG TPA: alpha/beta hydrolase [Nocardioidaceae bacterium]|nr:alpha/beta hydrolase [Nocardioidaceae bacterium]